jgi:hypothetical protein
MQKYSLQEEKLATHKVFKYRRLLSQRGVQCEQAVHLLRGVLAEGCWRAHPGKPPSPRHRSKMMAQLAAAILAELILPELIFVTKTPIFLAVIACGAGGAGAGAAAAQHSLLGLALAPCHHLLSPVSSNPIPHPHQPAIKAPSTQHKHKHPAPSTTAGPPPVSRPPSASAIKCHMPPKEHMQLGWVVCRVLST